VRAADLSIAALKAHTVPTRRGQEACAGAWTSVRQASLIGRSPTCESAHTFCPLPCHSDVFESLRGDEQRRSLAWG
jgi:hypothetical protein